MNGDNNLNESLYVGNTLINSEWFDEVLTGVGFFNAEYPKTQAGFLSFLTYKRIIVSVAKMEKYGWVYVGYDEEDEDIFTQDYNEYEDFDTCLNTAIVECTCYLYNKRNKKDN